MIRRLAGQIQALFGVVKVDGAVYFGVVTFPVGEVVRHGKFVPRQRKNKRQLLGDGLSLGCHVLAEKTRCSVLRQILCFFVSIFELLDFSGFFLWLLFDSGY